MKALGSIPAVKGVEIGGGFACAALRGSENNDVFQAQSSKLKAQNHNSKLKTKTNNAGGILGGISNGMPIVARIAIKPASSISREQETVDRDGNLRTIRVLGRHDPCVVPRAVPIAEAMMALVLVDHWLRARVNQMN